MTEAIVGEWIGSTLGGLFLSILLKKTSIKFNFLKYFNQYKFIVPSLYLTFYLLGAESTTTIKHPVFGYLLGFTFFNVINIKDKSSNPLPQTLYAFLLFVFLFSIISETVNDTAQSNSNIKGCERTAIGKGGIFYGVPENKSEVLQYCTCMSHNKSLMKKITEDKGVVTQENKGSLLKTSSECISKLKNSKLIISNLRQQLRSTSISNTLRSAEFSNWDISKKSKEQYLKCLFDQIDKKCSNENYEKYFLCFEGEHQELIEHCSKSITID